jgi:archaellum component FlaC
MADAENFLLEDLGHMRRQLDRVEHRLDDVVARLGDVERTTADHSVQLAEINSKSDRPDARIARIEKRLDLVEG